MIIGTMNSTTLHHGAVRLADWGLICAQGAEAASFLQGQLTQDVVSLAEGSARLAGFCTAKGRLMASFVVWRVDRETFYLACSADLLAPTLKRLSMFVMRAKCKLSDVSADIALHGLVGAHTVSALGADGIVDPWTVAASGDQQLIRLPDAEGLPRCLLAAPFASDLPAAVLALPALSPDDWAWLEVRSGVVRIVAATTEHFVPQMVNFELVGGVNFQKGCYPGQEVVARSQYRGTLKRRLMAFDCAATLAPGQDVFHSNDPGQPAGEVALSALRPAGGSSALIEVKLAALDSGSLHLGAADGPVLLRATLPYAISVDAG